MAHSPEHSDEVPDAWDAESDMSEEDNTPTADLSSTNAPANGHSVPPKQETANSDGESDESEEAGSYETTVLSDYRKLQSRLVDIVGDYAGNELFLIDGDSLLLRCFSDPHLDFNPGFQLLHAVYSVEQVLEHLARRKCNFHLVFFRSNKTLCIPSTASKADVPKYLLARAAIIQHLMAHLPSSRPQIEIEEFSAYTSSEFTGYLVRRSPYFIMAHDGAASSHRRGEHVTEESEVQFNKNRVALREMILFFSEEGFNVSLINGLEWRDTKVMALLLERHRRDKLGPVSRGSLLPPFSDSKGDEIATLIGKAKASGPQLTQRQLLTVISIVTFFQQISQTTAQYDYSGFVRSFLEHIAALSHLHISARRFEEQPTITEADNFLQLISYAAESALYSEAWTQIVSNSDSVCDLSDFVDGRLLSQIDAHHPQLTDTMQQTFIELATTVNRLSGINVLEHKDPATARPKSNGTQSPPASQQLRSLVVMPFSNLVFDAHLSSIRLEVDERIAQKLSSTSHKVFREVIHWHNAKKPIVQRGPPTVQSAKEAFWANKRNQIFMSEMQKYAASLTNAVGRSLEPETVIVGKEKLKALPSQSSSGRATPDSDSTESSITQTTRQVPPKKGGGGKKGQQAAGKQAIMNQIAATKARKDEASADKVINAWRTVCKDIDVGKDVRVKFSNAKAHLASLPPVSRDLVAGECQLYMVSCLLYRWSDICKKEVKVQHMELAALIWSICGSIMSCNNLTKEVVSNVNLTVKTLGLPPVPTSVDSVPSRALPFAFALPTPASNLSVRLPSKAFQLQYCGPYMERSFDSAPDPRVDFHPDGWQRRVLDAIDARRSVFAVAPTSAGKTFISFYAMRRVLEADDDGVLVYVAPTKALVNQIAAEIQARYSKKFKHGGKSVWAIHTRDYRINNPTGCQVLVTVPHVLQIMMLAPSNASAWSTRVKTIILDEIHSIGQAEDGVVWEQLLLLSPCPIIALSATVGNPAEFSDWLTTTQKAIGVDLETVQHPHRYSDLRKYYYVPPKEFAFSGVPEKSTFGTLGLEHATGLNRIHPIAGLVDRSRGIPEDLALEPLDCFELYQTMLRHCSDRYPMSSELDPKTALPEIPRKVDILRWEHKLKDLLRMWIADAESPFKSLIQDLEQKFRSEERESVQTTRPTSTDAMTIGCTGSDSEDLCTWTLSLLCRLHEQDALPAILFNYDRHKCEEVCQTVFTQLQEAEQQQVKSGPAWTRKLEKFEEWKKLQERNASKVGKKTSKKGAEKDDEKTSKLDSQRDAISNETSPWDAFDPDAPVDGYHFADYSKVLLSEMDIYVRQLKRRDVKQWLIDALKRGVGVHHAGMNRKYRSVVEILFRKGFLRVVIATGTLALGVNMPCKTVVFSGDSVFLTALNYRQCAGRAGRRGFDLLGNVVFQGVSREKVCRLISSRLPDLNGHFPITTTLVLRLFTLLHDSKQSKYASSSINALLSQPRLFLGSEAFKDQVMHHLRFSIEYLRRQYLLSPNGAPMNFAGLVSHLYFTENSSFAFHALLKEGYFHELCASIDKNETDTMETMMLVMAHLFNRIPCRQSDEECQAKVVKPSSSIVFLPPLPNKAAEILRSHNQQTLDVYRTYVETFVEQHITSTDNKLPLTGIKAGAESETTGDIHSLPPTKTRSSFVALSGHGDDFATISDLCQTTRDGVFLEEAVIPYVGIHPEETGQPLNAWLLDFFKHGDINTIERANGIRRSDIWFMLNDFSLVLATITASLLGFMKLKNMTDMDMLDVTGQGDAFEEAQDDAAAAAEEQEDSKKGDAAGTSTSLPMLLKPIKKKTKAESWEDLADEEEAKAEAEVIAEADSLVEDTWDPDEQGLRKVLQAFTRLHAEFNVKFRAMWA